MAISSDRVSSMEDGAFVYIRPNLLSSGSVIDILKEANPDDSGNGNIIDCNGTDLTLVEGVSDDDYSGVYLTSGGETENLLNSDGDFDISGLTIPQGYEFCVAVTLPSNIVSDSTITVIVEMKDAAGTRYVGTIVADRTFETTTYLGGSNGQCPATRIRTVCRLYGAPWVAVSTGSNPKAEMSASACTARRTAI
jgi:hypothetical protein